MVLLSLQQLTDEVIEVSTNKTLNLYDIHTVQKCTNSNKISIVIPPDTINAVFPYTEIKVLLTANGDVEIVNGDNIQVTVSRLGVSADIHTLTGKGTLHTLIRESANKWIIISDQAGGDASGAIATHNTSGTAHSDIRTLISSHTSSTSNPHGVTATQVGAIASTEKGAVNGVATLNSSGKVPSGQLYTDEITLVELSQDFAVGANDDAVVFNNVIYNHGSQYNSTTGVFTCSSPGLYLYTASARVEINSGASGLTLQLFKNSTIKYRGQEFFTYMSAMALTQSGLVFLNSGETLYVNVRVISGTGTIKYYANHILGAFSLVRLK